MDATIANYTVRKLINEISEGNINFNLAIQRGNVWKEDKKSDLVYSILKGYPTGIMYFTKNEDVCDALDGKQRCTAIKEFIDEDFELSEDFVITHKGEDFDFGSYVYRDLPDWAKNIINEYTFTICFVTPKDETERNEFFYYINNGVALSKIEKTRAKAISFDKFKILANHDIMKTIISEKGRISYKDELVAEQSYSMLYMPKTSFSKDKYSDFIMNVSVSDEQINHLKMIFDWIKTCNDELVTANKEDKHVARAIKTQSHFVSIVYLAHICMENCKTRTDFYNLMYNFFKDGGKKATMNEKYNHSCSMHTAEEQSITVRKSTMDFLLKTVDGIKENDTTVNKTDEDNVTIDKIKDEDPIINEVKEGEIGKTKENGVIAG